MRRAPLAFLLVALTAGSAAAEQTSHRHVVSPQVELWFDSPGFRAFWGRRMAHGPDPDRVPVTVRVSQASALPALLDLDGDAVAVTRNGREPSALGSIASAVVTRDGLAQLAKQPWVVRVELDVVPPFAPPLDATAAEIDATDAWPTRDAAQLPVTGNGVLIADIDSGIDVFHPLFFRADGAYYDWIDTDADERFTPGVDQVVVDGAPAETGYFEGVAYQLGGFDPILGTDDGAFDLGMDHLYIDANANGRRDYGPGDGFAEADAGYGETLLLGDDVNGNGRIDAGEKLVGLGTSKIRGVFDGDRQWTRGTDLIDAPGHDDAWAFHGVGVTGILAGGNRGMTRLVGIAPDAEVLIGAFSSADSLSPLLTWAVQQGADVILHEYAPWVGYHRDGSSNHETMMDTASAGGAVNVNPTGNLGGALKHAVVDLAPQGATDMPVRVPPGVGYNYIQITVHWRESARDLSFVLEAPGGAGVADLGTAGATVDIDNVTIQAYRDDSSRGTAMFDIILWNGIGTGIHAGEWTLAIADVGGTDLGLPDAEIALYVADDVSGWGQGVSLPVFSSEQYLIGFPATADSAVSVAAYTGRGEPPYNFGGEATGQLRWYSCRGLRIDGASIMDIAAPDNPLSAANPGLMYTPGSYAVFGGTSGAGPHVAGTAALIKQLDPSLSGEQVRDAIRGGALVDGDVAGSGGLPREQLWGAGKLRTYRALYGEDPAPNTPPTVTRFGVAARPGEPFDVPIEVGDAEDAPADLTVRVDLDYDGVWDAGPAAPAEPVEAQFEAEGTYYVKVEATDTGGLATAALIQIVVAADDDEDSGGCGCRTGNGGDAPLPLGLLAVVILAAVRRTIRRDA